jgi:MerC mercury resistance protein
MVWHKEDSLVLKVASDKGILDRLAVGLSGLCLLHCVASALVVMLLASAGGVLLDPLIHEIGLAVAVLLGAAALGQGFVKHRDFFPLVVGLSGLALMAIATQVPHGLLEIPLTIAGVTILAFGHFLNRRTVQSA